LALFFLGLPALINVNNDPWLSDLFRQQAVFWVYLQNWLFAYTGQFPGSSYLDHFWSLAIEEQFYIVWPTVIFLLNRRFLLLLCPLLIVVALALRVQLLLEGSSWVTIYVHTFARMDVLMCGALLRLLYELKLPLLKAARHWLVALAALLFVAIAALFAMQMDFARGPGTQTVGYLVIALLFGLLIHFTLQSQGGILQRLFEHRWLVTLGKYSYGAYILHWPIFYFLYTTSGFYRWAVYSYGNLAALALILTVGMGGTLSLAALSWHCFEAPMLGLREGLEARIASSRGASAPRSSSANPPDPGR
jgi:peptidoglycan/LPS O-acetylase OafA/YrhL